MFIPCKATAGFMLAEAGCDIHSMPITDHSQRYNNLQARYICIRDKSKTFTAGSL